MITRNLYLLIYLLTYLLTYHIIASFPAPVLRSCDLYRAPPSASFMYNCFNQLTISVNVGFRAALLGCCRGTPLVPVLRGAYRCRPLQSGSHTISGLFSLSLPTVSLNGRCHHARKACHLPPFAATRNAVTHALLNPPFSRVYSKVRKRVMMFHDKSYAIAATPD